MFYNCPVTTYFLSLYRSYEGVIRLATSQRTCTKLFHMSTWWNLSVAFRLHNIPTRRGEYSLCLKKKILPPCLIHSFLEALKGWNDTAKSIWWVKGRLDTLSLENYWAPKNWCFWTVVFEKTFENPLDFKEFQPVHPKGDKSWVFTGSVVVEAETPILWPPDVKNWLV